MPLLKFVIYIGPDTFCINQILHLNGGLQAYFRKKIAWGNLIKYKIHEI